MSIKRTTLRLRTCVFCAPPLVCTPTQNYALAPYTHKHVQTSKPKQQYAKKERAYVNSRAIDHFNSLGSIQQQKLPLGKLSLNGPDFRVTRTSGYIHTPEADQGHWHLTVSQDPNNLSSHGKRWEIARKPLNLEKLLLERYHNTFTTFHTERKEKL